MSSPRLVISLSAALVFSIPCFAQDKSEPNFPTDDEIRLLLTQTDRAIQQYKPLLAEEELLFGAKGKDAVAKDRQVVNGLETAIKAFQKNPQGFNGPLGFAFFEWIDDADRNVLLCASSASTEATLNTMAGNSEKAQSLMRLSNGCMDLSALFYTVSENAGALYTRYVQGEEALAEMGAQAATKCAEVLKQIGARPKQ